MKTKPTLLASSPTIEGIKNSITKFYFGSEKELKQVSENEYSILGKNGTLEGVRVVKKRNRFRFEMV